jgi:hypothetical protein
MKKVLLGLTATAVLTAGVFTFIGCEKTELKEQTESLNVIKCWGEDDLEDDIYISFPDNPNVIIRLRDSLAVTLAEGVLVGEATGTATWNPNHTSFVCSGSALDCGRAYITETHGNETNIIKEGIFAHVYNPDGTVQYTAYDWNHQMPRD